MSALFRGLDKDVTIPMASGAILTIGGTAVALCSTAMGSTSWPSIVSACCGAGLYIQSIAAAAKYAKKQKATDLGIFDQKLVVEDFVYALFPSQREPRQKNASVDTFCTFLKDSTKKIDWALSEACFWNEIENYSKSFTKEQQFFAKMDRELYAQLKNLLSAKPKIEGGSLIIEETDLFERIEEILLAHKARCEHGLATLEQEYKLNAKLVAYLENNEPNIDVKKDSPVREIVPGEHLDIFYHQSPKRFERKEPKFGPGAPDSKMDHSSSQIYPDSPGSHRDMYYPRASPRHTPKKSPKSSKTPKKSPKGSGSGTTTKSPKGSPSGTTTKSPKGSPSGTTTKSPKGSPSGTTTKSPKGSPSGTTTKSPKGSPSGTTTKSPKSPNKSPQQSTQKSPKQSPESPNKSPRQSPKNSPKN